MRSARWAASTPRATQIVGSRPCSMSHVRARTLAALMVLSA